MLIKHPLQGQWQIRAQLWLGILEQYTPGSKESDFAALDPQDDHTRMLSYGLKPYTLDPKP